MALCSVIRAQLERVRKNSELYLLPAHRHSNREFWSRAWRVGANRCRTSSVAKIIDEQASGSGALRRDGVSVISTGESFGQLAAISMRSVMRHFRPDWHHDVQSLPTRHLGPARKAFIFQNPTELQGSIGHEFPSNAFAGIEIKDEPVGKLDIVNRSVPRMQFNHSNLDETKQALEILDP
jgi:hypothetical protein